MPDARCHSHNMKIMATAVGFTRFLALAIISFALSALSFQQQVPFVFKSFQKPQRKALVVFANVPESSLEESSNPSDMIGTKAKQSFAGRSVLLTGASGGLGSALALELAACEVAELVLSGRNEEALQSVATQCRQVHPGLQTHIVVCDLSDKKSVQNLGTKALELCSTIDILINNGGISSRSNFVDTSLEVDERVMQINFFAGAALAKMVIPNMIQNKSGKIIWISSVQGLLGIPSRTSYAASKFAVQGYCESLRAEMAGNGISVHVASPGYIRTNLSLNAVKADGKAYGKMDETTLKGAEPQKVAVDILNRVAAGKNDFIVAASFSAIIAIWLRMMLPSVLQKVLVKRFEKAEKLKDD